MSTTPSTEAAELREMVADLQRRLARMEAELLSMKAAAGNAPIPIETVLSISAAVAAYLGEKAQIRQIHYASSGGWAQSGRAAHHASHSPTRTTR